MHVRKADIQDSAIVSEFVKELLLELEPQFRNEIECENFEGSAKTLLKDNKIKAFIAFEGDSPIGLATTHECYAIYANGKFGEIDELYVIPEYRSSGIGELLLKEIYLHGELEGWKRIQVGTPPENEWKRTVNFYKNNGFNGSGLRISKTITNA